VGWGPRRGPYRGRGGRTPARGPTLAAALISDRALFIASVARFPAIVLAFGSSSAFRCRSSSC
jgi:hypothetical protein